MTSDARVVDLALRSSIVTRAAVLALLAAVGAHGASANSSAFAPPRPHTLVTVPGSIAGFAQHGDHLVWANGYARCGRIVELRTLSTGRSRFLDARNGPMCEEAGGGPGGIQHDMALSGTRALWAYVFSTFSQDHFRFFTTAPGDRVERSLIGFSVDHDDPLSGPTPLAGGEAGLYIANGAGFAGEDGGSPASLYRVTRSGAKAEPGTGRVFDVASSGRRIAVAQRIPGGCVCNYEPAWSPDGGRIAFFSGRAGGSEPQLYVMNADGSGLRLLVDDVGFAFEWSPSGEHLAVKLAGSNDLAVVRSDGSARRIVNPRSLSVFDHAWSPDGRWLALEATAGTERGLYAVPASGGAPIRLGPGGELLSWSPDSSRIVHTVFAGDVSHNWVVPLSGSPPIDLGPGYDPSWSPDGSAIAYLEPHRVLVVSSDGTGGLRVAASFATDSNGATGTPRWSPDGQWLAVSRAGTQSRGLWIARPDGGQLRKLAPSGDPGWSPDSTRIAFVHHAGADGFVSVVDVAGGPPRQLATVGASGETTLRYSPDGTRLLFATGEIAVIDVGGGSPSLLTKTVPDPERVAVELRRSDGARLSTFDAPLSVRGLAFSGSRVALVLHRSSTRSTLEIRTAAGKLERRVGIPRPAWNQISMSGRWVVFWSWPRREGELRTIRLLDAASGRTCVLAKTQVVVGLSIDGRRVAWGELAGRQSRIRAVLLPRS